METLNYGFKKPQTGDKGSTFFPALEDDIQKMNDHLHDGTETPRLTTKSVTMVTASILAAGWTAVSNGIYKQTVTMPVGMLFNDFYVNFKLSSGHQVFPSVEKVSASTYDVFVNDNSLNLTAVYG